MFLSSEEKIMTQHNFIFVYYCKYMNTSSTETSFQARDPELWRQARRRAKFKRHLYTYLIVNSALWLIWLFSGMSSGNAFEWNGLWPIFPTLGWGIGLAFDWFTTYNAFGGSLEEKEYQKLLRKRESQS
jgi:hypothetical protein